MNNQAQPPHLLWQIHALGDQLGAALEDHDLERAQQLTEERETLLRQLLQFDHPSFVGGDWAEAAQAIEHQHRFLAGIMAELEEQLQEDLAALRRQRAARHSYQGSGAPSHGILNDHVHG